MSELKGRKAPWKRAKWTVQSELMGHGRRAGGMR
jgi:hypothetical protein